MSNDYIQRLNAWGDLSKLLDLLNGLPVAAPQMVANFERKGIEDPAAKLFDFSNLLLVRAQERCAIIEDLTPGFKVRVFFDAQAQEWTYEAHRFPLVGGGLNG